MARLDQRERLARATMRSTKSSTRPPLALRAEPRLEHARLVEHQGIARVHQARQVAEPKILDRAVGAQVQQAAGAALARRMLRDELGRQLVVELGDQHPGNYNYAPLPRRNGGTGRRSGLKIRRWRHHESSSLSSGTKYKLINKTKPTPPSPRTVTRSEGVSSRRSFNVTTPVFGRAARE